MGLSYQSWAQRRIPTANKMLNSYYETNVVPPSLSLVLKAEGQLTSPLRPTKVKHLKACRDVSLKSLEETTPHAEMTAETTASPTIGWAIANNNKKSQRWPKDKKQHAPKNTKTPAIMHSHAQPLDDLGTLCGMEGQQALMKGLKLGMTLYSTTVNSSGIQNKNDNRMFHSMNKRWVRYPIDRILPLHQKDTQLNRSTGSQFISVVRGMAVL